MVMHFSHGNPKRSYYMNREKLTTAKEERDIGVLVSDNLKPSAQCAKAARTAYLLGYLDDDPQDPGGDMAGMHA